MKFNKVGAVSLGCSKNAVDTEIMLGELKAYGFEIASDAKEAEIIIVNTCGFITSAKQDSIDAILEMAQYKLSGACKMLIVTGCLSQRYPEELRAELPEVDMFWGVKDYPLFAARLAAICGHDGSCSALNSACPQGSNETKRLLTTPSHRAYLRIADGCDNRCTYCAIPLIRGGRVSVPMEKLLDEAASLAKNGVTELTVIAQDTSAYGIDLYGRPMLKELLLKLATIDELKWIRLLYTYPNTVTEDLIDAMRDNPKICNYIDMPIQHISSAMLGAMNRHGSAEHIKHITDYIRDSAPDFILRTTVMLGFPGETDADFDELMLFMREHPFDRVGAFVYSAEDGTKASEMDDQVDTAVAESRLDALMRMQRSISLELNKKRIGTVTEALVERVENGTAYCRSYAEAADVDGLIKVKLIGTAPAVGDYINIRITAADYYDLIGETL
ncbi:MAG: 30S ribosomal protein S12 methylthiotransferase RimO [Christensenellaceae bacterium]|nr:30S ribosomal protein S12 methylthiotransferase RimO [Christensenellaceae bacterium]